MRSKSNQDDDLIVDINVTPLVDVVLVLLVIFMVTATYMVAQSIPVDLPEASTGEEVTTTFAITITEDGKVYLDGSPADDSQIKEAIVRAKQVQADVRVVIAADKTVPHGQVISVIDLLRREGITKFAINIQTEDAG